MKETAGSLRAYFALVAVAGGGLNLNALVRHSMNIRTLTQALAVCLAALLLYAAIRLDRLLVTGPGQVRVFVLAWAVVTTLNGAAGLLFLRSNAAALATQASSLAVAVVFAWIIAWYLLTSVRRLSAEAIAQQATDDGPAAVDPTNG